MALLLERLVALRHVENSSCRSVDEAQAVAAPLPHRLAGLESACGQHFPQPSRGDGAERLSILLVVPSLGSPLFSAHDWPPPIRGKAASPDLSDLQEPHRQGMVPHQARRQRGAGRTT